ncbi:hypothetical protein DEDE109153_18345 [Deinococcus deserti]|uniref:Uncharacterized protein n=1 Tax=Deinococcus deserti (strain DSM 17065 / CIP 109153 / LMG 22923 / VCD115) TaxID=546414 RepID=C1CYF2_DEIDV|nr:hypothetical protein [Deinococcus deserti]ACO44973.2 Conserved hypothetical protein; putative membrane protein [Deinococcus deserti VCD115]
MPPYLPQLLLAFVLVGLTFSVSYLITLGGQTQIDVLDAALLMLALVNLRLGWSGARHAHGGRTPLAVNLAGLIAAALITWRMLMALSPLSG